MNTGQCAGLLKILAILFPVCLLTACASNSSPFTSENNQWFSCRTSSSDNGWDCHQRDLVEPDKIQTSEKSAQPASGQDQVASLVSKEQEPDHSPVQTALTSENNKAPLPSGNVHYSLQLAAFTVEERRDRYLLEMPIARADLILSQDQGAGQTWWLVLYGNYQEYSEALKVQEYLADNFGILDTWVKPLD